MKILAKLSIVPIDKYYGIDSDICNIDHDCMVQFLTRDVDEVYGSFEELFDAIGKTKIKTSRFTKKKGDMNSLHLNKTILFVYFKIMKFPAKERIEETMVSSNFLKSVTNINVQ